jgi:hypothetical protein
LLPGRCSAELLAGRWFGETMVSRCQNEMQTI